MKKFFFLIVYVAIYLPNSFACVNGETRMLKDGTIISVDEKLEKGGSIIPLGHQFFEIEYDKKLAELYRLWRVTKDIDYLSDYGVLLILKGDYRKAVETYLKIEKIKPNRYSTASNIGTAYELLGQNEDALKWIKKAYRINPKSHNSSEWIHVNILKAKIKGEQFINSQFLLSADFGNDTLPETKLSNEELLNLREALYYQLNERVSFIKSNDKIVARLLFDLANVAYLTGMKEHAAIIYEKAKAYGFTEPLLAIRHAKAKGLTILKPKIVEKAKEQEKNKTWIFLGTFSALLILTLWAVVGMRKKRMRQ